MKTWYSKIHENLDDAAIYVFTVLCTIFGGYIQNGVKPELGWLPLTGAMISSVFFCAIADWLRGKIDTPQKRASKKKNFMLNLIIAGAFGLGSSVIMPALIKMVAGSVGVSL